MENVSVKGLEGLIEKAIQEVKDWIIVANLEGSIIYANNIVYDTCKLTRSEVLGKDLCMFLGLDLQDDQALLAINKLLSDGKKFELLTCKKDIDDSEIYLTNSIISISDIYGEVFYVSLSKDITADRRKKMSDQYSLDNLTNYPNQKKFFKAMSKQIVDSKKENSRFAILIIDIKGIQRINGVYGIKTGNNVIKYTGNIIKTLINENQQLFKYDGNSFVIINEKIEEESEIEIFIKDVISKLEEPVEINGINMDIEVNVGISVLDENLTMPHEIIERAQIALDKAKHSGDNVSYVFYKKDLKDEVKSLYFYEKELRLAVQNNEFILYYQPFIDLKTNIIIGAEALIRRKKSNGEIVPPSEFMDVLEKTKLMEKVGIQILEQICTQLNKWKKKGYVLLPISVNLSAGQFRNPNLAKEIMRIVEEYRISPRYIVLEITETMMLEEVAIARGIIEELKDYGFAISIDDFGTGYASIGYLKKFMFDHLKIDISFVKEITKSTEDRVIVEAIIAIAKTFNLKTVAEGIESEEQLHILMGLGCEVGQGYLWDKPITAEEIEKKYLKYIN